MSFLGIGRKKQPVQDISYVKQLVENETCRQVSIVRANIASTVSIKLASLEAALHNSCLSAIKRRNIEKTIKNIQENKKWYIDLAELKIYNEIRNLITDLINEFANDNSSYITKYKNNDRAEVCLSGTANTTKNGKTYSDISFNIIIKDCDYETIMNQLDILDEDDIEDTLKDIAEKWNS